MFVCVCVCVLMTSSWSAKSLHVEGHSFRSPPLGVMNFKRNLEGERNLQLETAGQFSWAVSSPPPQKKWLMWSLATICQPCRCGVGSDNLLAWNRWKGTIWNNYWNNYTWHVTFMGSSGHASWNIFCFKSPCLWGGKMCLMDDFWNEILNEDPNIIPQLSTTSCI